MARWVTLLCLGPLISPAYSYNPNKSPGRNAVLLSNVQTLTLHSHRQTSHRRVPAIPQLRCIGPSEQVCNLYTPDVMQCTNQGADYSDEDIQWSCSAQLPEEFKLGSTDVVCEGYRDAEDPWVLKGSCGVEYGLLLTDKGEERYGDIVRSGYSWLESVWNAVFGVIFFGVLGFILLAMFGCFDGRDPRQRGNRGWGWGWGWGGGGGGDDGGWGPPPPYDQYQSPRYSKNESWRPGFWSGALGGAAAGYALGRSRDRDRSRQYGSPQAGPSRPSFSSRTTSTSESTGFGSTRRR